MTAADAKIPMLDLSAQHAELEEELLEGFAAVLASGRFVLGEPVEAFESDLAKLCDVPHGIGCNSGTDALWLALRGLGVGPGDAVLCPAYSFFATAATIVRAGARPIFADILPASLNLDPEDAIRRVEEVGNLRAVISVDLFGRVCDLGPLEAYCHDREIPIIQDAAQSIGALDASGRKIGSRADIACFSFYPTKNLGGFGDAGMLVTSDETLAERLRMLRGHGMHPRYHHKLVGINSRLDAIQAAALNVKLKHLSAWTSARQDNARRYHELFHEAGLADELGLPVTLPDRDHVWNQYTLRVPGGQRDDLRKHLMQCKIGTEIYYPIALHQQECFQDLPLTGAILPETERATREVLHLPIFPELTADQQRSVVGRIGEYFAREAKTAPHIVKLPAFSQETPQRRSA